MARKNTTGAIGAAARTNAKVGKVGPQGGGSKVTRARRGKTSPASTAGSFTTYAHKVAEVGIDAGSEEHATQVRPSIKRVHAMTLVPGDRLADGRVVISQRPRRAAIAHTEVLTFDGHDFQIGYMSGGVDALDEPAISTSDAQGFAAEVDRLAERSVSRVLPLDPFTGAPRTDIPEATTAKLRANHRHQVASRLRRALEGDAAVLGPTINLRRRLLSGETAAEPAGPLGT